MQHRQQWPRPLLLTPPVITSRQSTPDHQHAATAIHSGVTRTLITPANATSSAEPTSTPSRCGNLTTFLGNFQVCTHKILSLQYFDLSALLPLNLATARDTQSVRVQLGGDDSQHLLLSRRPLSKTVSSIHDWSLTFSMYAAVITTADPARGTDLFEYTRLIVS